MEVKYYIRNQHEEFPDMIGILVSRDGELDHEQKWSFARERVTRTAENASQGPAIVIAYGTHECNHAHIGKVEGHASWFPERGLRIANRNGFDIGRRSLPGISDCKAGIQRCTTHATAEEKEGTHERHHEG